MKLQIVYYLLILCTIYSVVSGQDTTSGTNQETAAPESTTEAAVTTTEQAATSVVTTTAEETTTAAATTTTDAITTTTATASSATASTTDLGDCLSADAFSTHDYFPNKLNFDNLGSTVKFNVTYSNTYKLVHNLVLDEYYVLYCTSSAPSLGATFQSKTYIQIPVKSFAAIDTRALGYLDLLGQSDNVVYVGNTTNVTSPCSTNTPAYFNVSDASLDRASYGLAIYPSSANNDPKGVGFGLDYSTSPLDNAQWVKYIALFTNQEVQADTIYNDISTDYATYRDSINKEGAIEYKRNVTFMDYDPSSTKFNIFQDQYFVNLTSDAGAVLQTFKDSELRPADPSVMKGELQNASVVIDFTPASAFNGTYGGWQSWLGYSDSKIKSAADTAFETYKSSRKYTNDFDAPPFARYGELYRMDLISNNGALDYWTRGFARPDLVLADLIQAQYPDFFKSRDRTFLRAFAQNEAVKSANKDSYQCTLNSWSKAASVAYTNSTSDRPDLPGSSGGVSLGLIIGVSVAGGVVAIACLATAIYTIIRKMKNRQGGRFTKLHDETMNEFGTLDKEILLEDQGSRKI